MTKLSLIGTASALALTLALAQTASATSPSPFVDDNQVNLWSDGNANDGSTITKTYTDNTDNSVFASSDDDKTANNSFNYRNREDKRFTVNLSKDERTTTDINTEVRLDKDDLKAQASKAALPRSMATPPTAASAATTPETLLAMTSTPAPRSLSAT